MCSSSFVSRSLHVQLVTKMLLASTGSNSSSDVFPILVSFASAIIDEVNLVAFFILQVCKSCLLLVVSDFHQARCVIVVTGVQGHSVSLVFHFSFFLSLGFSFKFCTWCGNFCFVLKSMFLCLGVWHPKGVVLMKIPTSLCSNFCMAWELLMF